MTTRTRRSAPTLPTWAVRSGDNWLAGDGEWDTFPASLTFAWLDAHRFDQAGAERLAAVHGGNARASLAEGSTGRFCGDCGSPLEWSDRSVGEYPIGYIGPDGSGECPPSGQATRGVAHVPMWVDQHERIRPV